MTALEEKTLAVKIQAGLKANDELSKITNISGPGPKKLTKIIDEGQKAKNRFIESNIRLVISIAFKFTDRGVPVLDLIQEGNIALMTCVHRFDPNRDIRFATFATHRIRGAIIREIDNHSRTIRIPVHSCKTLKHLQYNKGKNNPNHVNQKLSLIARDPISLDAPVDNNSEAIFGAATAGVGNALSPENVANQTLLKEKLEQKLSLLPPREAMILRMNFGLKDGQPYSLREIGNIMGLTFSWIQILKARALTNLRQLYGNESLNDSLGY